jgi:hypothetical protein
MKWLNITKVRLYSILVGIKLLKVSGSVIQTLTGTYVHCLKFIQDKLFGVFNGKRDICTNVKCIFVPQKCVTSKVVCI